MKRILEQKGFTLVEVLMVAGLAGGIGLVITQVMSNMNKGLKNTENQSDIMTVTQSIQRVLATPDNCTATFIGKNPKNASNVVNALKDKSSGVFMDSYKNIAADPNMKYGQGQIRIKSYSLSDSAPDVEVDTLLTTHFIIDFEKGKNAFGGKNLSKRIPLKVVLDGSGNIKTCISLTNASDNIWKYANNNIDIFFNGGNIGVGTTTPMAMVHIDDNSFFANSFLISTDSSTSTYGSPRMALVDTKLGTASTAPAWYIDNWLDRFRIFRSPNLTTAGQEHLTITNAGLVGLGTGTPQMPLHISNGNSGGSGDQTAVQIGDAGPAAGPLFLTHNAPNVSGNTYYTGGNWRYGGGTGKATTLDLNTGFHFFTSLNAPGPRGSSVTDLSEKMIITPGGNVGIGTTNPITTLDVNGTIRPTGASPGGSCSPLGAQSYNSSTGAPLYCNNSGQWTEVGGGGTLSIDIYQCPATTLCNDGQIVSGSWASYGCLGQVSSVPNCWQGWWNSGPRACNNPCTYLGKVRVN